MDILGQIVGIVGIVVLLLGYQQKTRGRIIAVNMTARLLFILQYVLLLAFEGAVMDFAAMISTFVAGKKETPFVKKYRIPVLIVVNGLIIAAGLSVYEDIFSLSPIVAVLFQTSGLWLSKEKNIRRVCILGGPFWFIYNFSSKAYASCAGDIMGITSLLIAMLRYDWKRDKKEEKNEPAPVGADNNNTNSGGKENE